MKTKPSSPKPQQKTVKKKMKNDGGGRNNNVASAKKKNCWVAARDIYRHLYVQLTSTNHLYRQHISERQHSARTRADRRLTVDNEHELHVRQSIVNVPNSARAAAISLTWFLVITIIMLTHVRMSTSLVRTSRILSVHSSHFGSSMTNEWPRVKGWMGGQSNPFFLFLWNAKENVRWPHTHHVN